MEELFDNLYLGTHIVTQIDDRNCVLPKNNDSAMYDATILHQHHHQQEQQTNNANFHVDTRHFKSFTRKESKRNKMKHRKKVVIRERHKSSSLLSHVQMKSCHFQKKEKQMAKLKRKQVKDEMLTRIRKRQMKHQMRNVQKTLSMLRCSS